MSNYYGYGAGVSPYNPQNMLNSLKSSVEQIQNTMNYVQQQLQPQQQAQQPQQTQQQQSKANFYVKPVTNEYEAYAMNSEADGSLTFMPCFNEGTIFVKQVHSDGKSAFKKFKEEAEVPPAPTVQAQVIPQPEIDLTKYAEKEDVINGMKALSSKIDDITEKIANYEETFAPFINQNKSEKKDKK